MENNFGGGFNRIPNPNSFQRRNDYGSVNNSNQFQQNGFGNQYSADGAPIQSLDGRKWETRDQAMVANKEYYKKIGRDINHKPNNPDAFNITNFYHFDKD